MLSKRNRYLDIIRYICAVWIAFCHFIYFYDYFAYEAMYQFPLNIIFCGVTGKLALSMIVVILGIFASKPREKGVIHYSLERYIQFFLSALVINLIIYICIKIGLIYRTQISLSYVLLSSIKIDASIFEEFWVMRHLLYGSIACFINSKLSNNKMFPIILIFEIIFLLCVQKYWIAICIFGSAVNYLNQNDKITQLFKNKIFIIIIFILILFVIRQKESDIIYLVDGICSFLAIMIISNNIKIQKLIEKINIPNFFTDNYLGLFLIHPVINEICIYHPQFKISPIINYFLYFIICSICAFVVNRIISLLYNVIKNLINDINDKTIKQH